MFPEGKLSKRNQNYAVVAFASRVHGGCKMLKTYNNMSCVFIKNEGAMMLLRVLTHYIYKLIHTDPSEARICLHMIIYYKAVPTSCTPCMEGATHVCITFSFDLSVDTGSVPCALQHFPRWLPHCLPHGESAFREL